jgi:hypothetical protein
VEFGLSDKGGNDGLTTQRVRMLWGIGEYAWGVGGSAETNKFIWDFIDLTALVLYSLTCGRR